MAKQEIKEKKKIIKKIEDQYRLIIYNDTTFQSIWSSRLSRLKVFTITSLISAGIVLLVIVMIATTGLREYIPGYPKAEYRQVLVRTALQIDSLETELKKRDEFFQKIQAIVSGEVPEGNLIVESDVEPNDIVFQEYNHDSVFQDKVLAEQLSLSMQSNNTRNAGLSQIHFFVPLDGVVSNHFDAGTDHFGVDLVSSPNARISSILGGTVIFAGWTLETGYVMYIQHESNLISVYKHNAELLKEAGEKVNAGEAIAIVGNTGENTSGTHLHFELWYDGNPLNPEQYIDF